MIAPPLSSLLFVLASNLPQPSGAISQVIVTSARVSISPPATGTDSAISATMLRAAMA